MDGKRETGTNDKRDGKKTSHSLLTSALLPFSEPTPAAMPQDAHERVADAHDGERAPLLSRNASTASTASNYQRFSPARKRIILALISLSGLVSSSHFSQARCMT
jgi:hypothetical protein